MHIISFVSKVNVNRLSDPDLIRQNIMCHQLQKHLLLINIWRMHPKSYAILMNVSNGRNVTKNRSLIFLSLYRAWRISIKARFGRLSFAKFDCFFESNFKDSFQWFVRTCVLKRVHGNTAKKLSIVWDAKAVNFSYSFFCHLNINMITYFGVLFILIITYYTLIFLTLIDSLLVNK